VFLGKSGNTISRRDDEPLYWGEVIDAMLPGKDAIDGERDYQDRTWPNSNQLEVSGELALMQHYMNRALAVWAKNPGDGPALERIRKIAGIAVRCLENHGAPLRTESGVGVQIDPGHPDGPA